MLGLVMSLCGGLSMAVQILGVDTTTGASIYPQEIFYTSPPVMQVA